MATTEARERFARAERALWLEQRRLHHAGIHARVDDHVRDEYVALVAIIRDLGQAREIHAAWEEQLVAFGGDGNVQFTRLGGAYHVDLMLRPPAAEAGLGTSPATTVDQVAA